MYFDEPFAAVVVVVELECELLEEMKSRHQDHVMMESNP